MLGTAGILDIAMKQKCILTGSWRQFHQQAAFMCADPECAKKTVKSAVLL